MFALRVRLCLALAFAALFFASSHVQAAFTADCAFAGGGDLISRGFYVSNYQGSTLDTVTLAHSASVAGERTIGLTARLTNFNGTFIAVAQVTRTVTTSMSKSVFDFGGVAVPVGSRITFTQTLLAGDGSVFFDTGVGPCADVVETEDTDPPLSSFRRNSVGLVITGEPASIASAMTYDCPYGTSAGGDFIDRGFYITNYQGVTIDTVRLRHRASTPGSKTITLIARLNRYDGPLVGVASVTRNIDDPFSESLFDFGDVPLPAGSTVTFEQVLTAGSGTISYDVGFDLGPCTDVTQTNGVSPPLDTFRRNTVGVKITGRVASAFAITVVEYLHTVFGHYFMTADPDEIAGLDGGAYGGVFVRTGEEFLARNGPAPGTADVCRFFTVTFAPKSSHFYTADPVECAGVKLNPDWQFEKIAFYIPVPAGGVCGAGLIPIYRMYNNGMTGAPNHRFTTSPTIYEVFTTTLGWAPEGIRFCAPSPV
ncbi:MAG TPA: hypothetical protein VNB03_14810 [Casimicrobiaceae bacterium]|nr:hypothetical protein [Casimicrobiaceae bacterium]